MSLNSLNIYGVIDDALVGTATCAADYLSSLSPIKSVYGRFVAELNVEVPLLKRRWKSLLVCLVMQYVHGMFTQLVYRFHVPAEQPLPDAGFAITPELGPKHFWISEAMFAFLFGSFVVWLISPFFTERKTFYTVVVLRRLLIHLVCCQMLRALSFGSTILPGPAHHCRAGQLTARRDWVKHWWEHFIVDFRRQANYSCGDLIFSSHTTFILSFVLAFTYYGKVVAAKVIAWALALVLSVLIICSRKHYTVDIVVAWYVVPLVFLALERTFVTKRPESDAGKWFELQSVMVETRSASGGRESGGGEDAAEHEAAAGSLEMPADAEAQGSAHVMQGLPTMKGLRAAGHSRRPSTLDNISEEWHPATAASASTNSLTQLSQPLRVPARHKAPT